MKRISDDNWRHGAAGGGCDTLRRGWTGSNPIAVRDLGQLPLEAVSPDLLIRALLVTLAYVLR